MLEKETFANQLNEWCKIAYPDLGWGMKSKCGQPRFQNSLFLNPRFQS